MLHEWELAELGKLRSQKIRLEKVKLTRLKNLPKMENLGLIAFSIWAPES
jgi:hypothetical protein